MGFCVLFTMNILSIMDLLLTSSLNILIDNDSFCSLHQGNECDFRHSDNARMNPRDCWYWLNSNCLNPKCPFRHPVCPFPSFFPLCTGIMFFLSILASKQHCLRLVNLLLCFCSSETNRVFAPSY